MMAATLGCNTARVLYNAPVAGPRASGEPSTSSVSRLHLRGRRSKKLSFKLAGSTRGVSSLARASLSNDGDKVRELASEKAVESGQQVVQDAKNLAGGRQSQVELDAKADDAADAASDEGDVREKTVDVASDMAVDNTADVDALAKKDAGPLSETYGRSVEDTAEALETKAAEISDREARKETSSSSSGGNSGSFFQDQMIKEKVLDVASDSAVDEGAEVEGTAQKDAADMTSKIGGDLNRNKMTIEGMADTASKLEADRSNSEVEAGAKKSLEEGKRQFEGLTRTISKNLKEGIDASRPSLEELSRTASKGVKAGQENLDYAAEGAAELSGDAREVLDGAKGALDKRLKVINLAAEEARETGNLVAELAAKGWSALTKTTERFVGNFQKNAGELQTTAEQKAQEAKVKAEEIAEQAKSKLAEAKSTAEATADRAQSKFNEAKEKAQSKTEDLKNTAQEKASESKSKLEETADKAQSKLGEAKENAQSKTEDLKNTAQEKASESKSKLEDTADAAKSKAGEVSSSAKENVESKAGAEKDSFTTAVDKMKDSQDNSQSSSAIGQTPGAIGQTPSAIGQTPGVIGQTPGAQGAGQHTGSGNGNGKRSSVIGQTPGAEASVGYADKGKVNDEWKSKSQ